MESLFIPLFVSLAIGALIGLERESIRIHQKTRTIAGLRTFIFISLWGFLTGLAAREIHVYFMMVSFAAFVATLLIAYTIFSKTGAFTGLTTEIAATVVFILTSLTFFVDIRFILALGILVALALSFKSRLTHFLQIIPREAILATVEFAVLSAVILPFLPNEYFGPWQFFNPYVTWWVIVLISGIGFIGYILHLFLGSRGSILITSAIGGMISSTAVTSSLSNLSRTGWLSTRLLHAGLIFTNITAFVLVLVETCIINQAVFFVLLLPIATLVIISGIFVFFLHYKNIQVSESMKFENPFQLRSALSFGLFFALIAFLAKASNVVFGFQGLYITSIFTGLADIHATSLSLSQLAGSFAISNTQAAVGILLAMMSNLWVKLGIVFIFAHRAIRKLMIIYTTSITLFVILFSFLLNFFKF